MQLTQLGARALISIAALATLATFATPAAAQAFPDRSVRVTSPFPAGSGPDAVLRMIGEKMAGPLKQSLVVDAKPGANGFIAIEAVKRMPATGYELVMADVGHLAINPSLFKKLPYDPEKDFAPVTGLYRTSFFIAVAADGPIKNVKDLIAAAKAAPNKVTYGSNAVGGPLHLGAAQVEAASGTQMLHVPFKELAQLYGAVSTGEVTWAMASIASAGPLLKANKLRFIAIADRTRSPALPDVPTLEEAGGPKGVEATTWVALLAPKGTPAAAVNTLQQAVAGALKDPDIAQRLATFGFVPFPAGPAQLAELIRTDTPHYAALVKRTGASAD
jgi:tripartite-type tricarboxylate transporter receptor subunit TctC